MTSNSLTENEEHAIPSQILKPIFGLHASVVFSCDQAALQMVFSVCPSVCHTFLPLSPSGWRGIVVTVRAGGRPGGRLPNLRNPYLCNGLTDFLHSKFYGIV